MDLGLQMQLFGGSGADEFVPPTAVPWVNPETGESWVNPETGEDWNNPEG